MGSNRDIHLGGIRSLRARAEITGNGVVNCIGLNQGRGPPHSWRRCCVAGRAPGAGQSHANRDDGGNTHSVFAPVGFDEDPIDLLEVHSASLVAHSFDERAQT